MLKVAVICSTKKGAIVDFTNDLLYRLDKQFDICAALGYRFDLDIDIPVIDSTFEKGKFSAIDIFEYSRVVNWIKGQNPDIALFCSGNPTHLRLWDSLKDIGRVAYVHDPSPHSGMTLFRHHLYSSLLHRYYTQGDGLIFSSEALMESAVEDNSIKTDNLFSIPLPLLSNHVFPDIQDVNDRPIDFLFYGRMEYYKGVDVLLDAAEFLRNEGVNLNITVISKGDIQKTYPRVKKLPEYLTQVFDYVPDRELASYISKAKCVVLPYRDATGTQIIQSAYYYSTPVLITRTGALVEYAGENVAYIANPDDVSSLANAMRKVLANESERQRRGIMGKQRLDSYFSDSVISDNYRHALELVKNV